MKYKVLLAIILILVAGYFLYSFSKKPSQTNQTASPSNDSEARVIATKPDPLNEAIIPADQIIEISFNKPLQNVPEFKVKIEPKIEFKVELSPDRKVAKITALKPFELNTAYTLSIAPDTKFDGVGNWGKEQNFHFRTIKYRGI